MFAEMDRSQEKQRRQSQLSSEFILAKAEDDEVKMAQIREEQKEIGAYHPIAYGFECGDGWFQIIDECLTSILSVLGEKDIFEVTQIKEKLGTLRIYYEYSQASGFRYQLPYKFNRLTRWYVQRFFDLVRHKIGLFSKIEMIDNQIRIANNKSSKTCEVCGKPGKLNNKGWIFAACEEHIRK